LTSVYLHGKSWHKVQGVVLWQGSSQWWWFVSCKLKLCFLKRQVKHSGCNLSLLITISFWIEFTNALLFLSCTFLTKTIKTLTQFFMHALLLKSLLILSDKNCSLQKAPVCNALSIMFYFSHLPEIDTSSYYDYVLHTAYW